MNGRIHEFSSFSNGSFTLAFLWQTDLANGHLDTEILTVEALTMSLVLSVCTVCVSAKIARQKLVRVEIIDVPLHCVLSREDTATVRDRTSALD